MVDFFNEKKIRNEKNTSYNEYNCAGYALNTFSWYQPYESRAEQLDFYLKKNYSDSKLYKIAMQKDVETMLNDFKGRLRFLSDISDLKENERLVVYKFFIKFNIDKKKRIKEVEDSDFHFITKIRDKWMEKTGEVAIRELRKEISENLFEDWYYSYNDYPYDSKSIFFGLQE